MPNEKSARTDVLVVIISQEPKRVKSERLLRNFFIKPCIQRLFNHVLQHETSLKQYGKKQ